MASKIIELRQAEADKVNSNGDYDITLKYTNDLIVENGDQIMVKNIFVDTLAQSNQQINIAQEMTVNLDHYFYYILSRTDGLNEWIAGAGVPPVDGRPYFVCYETSGGAAVKKITSADFVGNYTNPVSGGTFEIDYTDPDGNPQKYNGNFPGSSNRADPSSTVQLSISFRADTTPTITANPQPANGVNLKISDAPGGPKVLDALTLRTTIKIPAGTYSPDQLVTEFNRIAQSARKGSIVNEIYENNFLKSTNNFVSFYGNDKMFLMRADGLKVAQIKNDADLLVGASFVELAYIPSQNQFAFEYIHTPYYIDATFNGNQLTTPAIAAVGYLPIGGTDFITVNKNSGVLFQNISSTYADGTDAKFFNNILGFELGNKKGSLTSQAETYDYTDAQGSVRGIRFDVNPPDDGVNITGGYIPLSAETNLTQTNIAGQNPPRPWWQGLTPVLESQVPFFSTTDDTYDILASQSDAEKNEFKFGYYLISVTSDFRSQFYGKEVKQNVMAILSRYYENNSFTSGTSDDSVIYIHEGPPINLQKFNIKILKPDKTVAENLGPESAVYLEIVKAGSQ